MFITNEMDINEENINLPNPDTIQPINRQTVHRICSGQVVLSLAIAVKELVENALDAGATNIEIRLKAYGSELIEVSDNGSGVREENFQALTLKHYTSKLREFSDLESVATLGFRGEALSSLCALSRITVITRHTSAEHGTKINYDLGGKIVTQVPVAREVGTTVTLEDLFSTLPVRRKDFMKNVKKEFAKMCQLLYAYCLVSTDVRFVCTNQTKSSKNTVVATEGAPTVRDNIISVFGAKQTPSLIEMEMAEPDESILEEYKVRRVPGESFFKCDCLISSAVHGSGRSTADRQFFYINSRPCEPGKVIKLVNEIYKQFNVNQYPFVYLNISMQRSFVDVNVTPDKRQIFLEKEKLLLATVKSSLLEAFKHCPSTFKVENADINERREEARGLKRPCKSDESEFKRGSLLKLFKRDSKSDSAAKRQSLLDSFNITVGKVATTEEEITPSQQNLEKLVSFAQETLNESQLEESLEGSKKELQPEKLIKSKLLNNHTVSHEEIKSASKCTKLVEENENIKSDVQVFENLVQQEHLQLKKEINKCRQNLKNKPQLEEPTKTKRITVRSSWKYLQEALNSCNVKKEDETVVRFRSQIAPSANKSAEQELQKQISKDMFRKMQAIGQFNLGFIIAKLENDLFIVDQHATDEKYNYEQLQLNTVLESQNFVAPKPLELTAANEELLIDNIDVFRKNGFNFLINSSAPATKKVSLTAVPISKSFVFGKDDIDEMLFLLQEEVNHSVCRPSRVQAMFASRACRKSVMVGAPLSKSDMRRLIDHMGEIDQPWNCPHGRPTMRHLINLKLIQNLT